MLTKLQEIKANIEYNNDFEVILLIDDYNWLIKQVEISQKVKEKVETIRNRLHELEIPTILKNGELGSLKQIADCLWKHMNEEVKRHGCSDLTLALEGSARGIYEIIELNNIKEKMTIKEL